MTEQTESRVDVDALAALLAAATPAGEWRAVEGDLEGGTLNDYIATLLQNRQNDATSSGQLFLTLAPNDIDPEHGAEVVPALTGDGPRAEANATLIATLVNAAPALLAEVAVLRAQVEAVEALAEAGLRGFDMNPTRPMTGWDDAAWMDYLRKHDDYWRSALRAALATDPTSDAAP